MMDARTKGKGSGAAVGSAMGPTLCAGLLALGCGGEPRARPDSAASTRVPAVTPAAGADSLPASPAAVIAFIRFVETQRTDSAVATRELAAEGLRRLAAAIEAVAPRDTSPAAAAVGPRLDALRARADSVGLDSLPTEQARRTGEAFALASDMLQTLQDLGQPALTDRVGEVRQAAAALRSDQPLAEQTDAVRSFFERAAAALRGIVGARAAIG